MSLINRLSTIWSESNTPFLICGNKELTFSQVLESDRLDLSDISSGDVVALIGDFTPECIQTLLRLIDIGATVVPLTEATHFEHEYFFEAAFVDVVIKGSSVTRRLHLGEHQFLAGLKELGHAGLILFSTGTTGRPKAILHDMTLFLRRYETPRPTLRTLNFLLFDHIGGINTLFHTLFNKGVVIAPESRAIKDILNICNKYQVEVLPTTPTFLRMMLVGGIKSTDIPPSLKLITYGTERMDQPTLDALCALLPTVDFRQTFGMSELGIVRVKSKARDSLFMKIGGEGVETKVEEGILKIRSGSRMIGYLNAIPPFDSDGWYDTKDIVEQCGDYIRVTGRLTDVINVGGLKFMASEVERVALQFPDIALVKAIARENPITGQHVELLVQPSSLGGIDKKEFMKFLKQNLQAHMTPKRIHVESIAVGHRFKKA